MKQSRRFSVMLSTFVFLMFASIFAGSSASMPMITDANWEVINKDGIGGCNGTIYAAAINNGAVYAGGSFTIAYNIAANYLAKWDGIGWSSLSSGLNNTVRAITFDGSGNLYAGGDFDSAGGRFARHIAKWDGMSWSALGAGTDSSVNALAFDNNGDLFVGGKFSSAGGVTASCIAKWDGNIWNAVGEQMRGPMYGLPLRVNALAFDGKGNLYAGGCFCYIGRSYILDIAKWNGTKWDSLGGGIRDNEVRALAFDSAGNLYAGGGFGVVGQRVIIYLAEWNGSQWDSLGSDFWYAGSGSGIYSLAIDKNGTIYAGGHFRNGSDMSSYMICTKDERVILSGSSTVYALVCDSNGALIAGEDFGAIQKWDGNIWGNLCSGSLGSGMDGNVKALTCDKNGNLLLGGNFTTVGGIIANYIAKWNNGSWSALGTGMTGVVGNYNNGVEALTCDDYGNCYAGGRFIGYLSKWNGVDWNSLGSNMSGIMSSYIGVKSLLCDHAGNIYAGGNFIVSGANNIAKWDGNKWNALGTGMFEWINSPYVYSLTFDAAGNVIAGGYFDSVGSVYTQNIAKWNGIKWDSLGNGLTGYNDGVHAVALDGKGNIFAGGNFIIAGPKRVNYIAQWNGTAWDSLGHGLNGYVNALAFDKNGNLFAGGSFDTAGGIKARCIAWWDGNGWSSLGSGTDGAVTSLVVIDSMLYVGGNFLKAGDKVSPYISRINLSVGNNPINSEIKVRSANTFIKYHYSNSTLVFFNLTPHDRVSLYSLSGRCMRQAIGVSAIKLTGIAPQPLFVRVSRAGKIVSTGMVMVE